MSKVVLTRFGNPILRQTARELDLSEIASDEIQTLIQRMRELNLGTNGVGLAAPQVGVSVALSIIAAHPTKLHPHADTFDAVIINPSYEGVGRRRSMWEGCLSAGSGNDILYAKALRYHTIRGRWIDEEGKRHDEMLHGLVAHIFQHETDHLQGILFVDRVRDSKTYMMVDEFQKRIVAKK